jgi:hypothetical protein
LPLNRDSLTASRRYPGLSPSLRRLGGCLSCLCLSSLFFSSLFSPLPFNRHSSAEATRCQLCHDDRCRRHRTIRSAAARHRPLREADAGNGYWGHSPGCGRHAICSAPAWLAVRPGCRSERGRLPDHCCSGIYDRDMCSHHREFVIDPLFFFIYLFLFLFFDWNPVSLLTEARVQ